ncbi:MAG: hypothetical protein HKN92_02675 [Chitinophagales bacterium]|nr:hypothetical protein [Chitinophagales bacterium]
MERLIENGLFGRGLIHLNKPALVDRYNSCLEDIGLPTSALDNFHIDGWGWSPEIADEMENKFYLSHYGPANPYAIIISPLQEDRPIYFPYHSFDRRMMKEVFRQCGSQISDLTTETAIWIDVDQEIMKYRSPQDLLMIESINLKFNSTSHLMKAAREQRELVRVFYDEENAWGDQQLHKKIIESCTKYGDLRFRSLDIPDIPFTNVRSFYSRAFEGVFIFRDLPGQKPLLVFKGDVSQFSGELHHGHIEYSLHDKNLLDRLFTERLCDIDWRWYKENEDRIKRIQYCLLADAITEEYPDIKLREVTGPRRKRLILELEEKLKLEAAYFELDRIMKLLASKKNPDVKDLSDRCRMLLAHPYEFVPEVTKDVIWQLLVNMSPVDTYQTFLYDKELFYDEYQKWNHSKKNWSIHFLKQEYILPFQ